MQEIDPLRRQGALLKKNSHLDVAARPGRGVRGLHESGRMTGGTGPALWSCPPLSSLSFLLLHRSGGRIGDVKLRRFQRTYVRRVRLIQQHGEFAEHSTGLRDRGDLEFGARRPGLKNA